MASRITHENCKDAKNGKADVGPRDMVLASDGKYYPQEYALRNFTPEPDPRR